MTTKNPQSLDTDIAALTGAMLFLVLALAIGGCALGGMVWVWRQALAPCGGG